jgi:hypothetical protein
VWRYGAGLLAGVGLGSLLAWLLHIYEIAHPTMPSVLSPGYPNMALTAFVLLVFNSVLGVGLGLVASTLIRKRTCDRPVRRPRRSIRRRKFAEGQATCPNDLWFCSRELTAMVRVEGSWPHAA